MVLVSMSEADSPNLLSVFQQVSNVGNNEVNTWLFLVWEHYTAVHYDDVVAVMEREHVFAYVSAAT